MGQMEVKEAGQGGVRNTDGEACLERKSDRKGGTY